jgi:hypothetical protein
LREATLVFAGKVLPDQDEVESCTPANVFRFPQRSRRGDVKACVFQQHGTGAPQIIDWSDVEDVFGRWHDEGRI